MKWAVIAVICTAAVINGRESKRIVTFTQETRPPSKQESSEAAPAPLVVINHDKSDRKQDGRTEKPETAFDRLFMPENWPNIALVLVGIGGIVVAGLTLKAIDKQIGEMRRQVDASMLQLRTMNEQLSEISQQTTSLQEYVTETKKIAQTSVDSARAALLNAQAVINAERPWILVEYEWAEIEGLEGVRFYAVNKGKTPGEMIEAYFEKVILPIIPDTLPLPPQYKSPILIPRRGDNLILTDEIWEFTPVPIHIESWIANEAKRDEVKNATEFAYFYGVIRYRDMLHMPDDENGMHYTRFCFTYNPFLGGTISPTGPSEYRQKT
jgi:hypothetical protein